MADDITLVVNVSTITRLSFERVDASEYIMYAVLAFRRVR